MNKRKKVILFVIIVAIAFFPLSALFEFAMFPEYWEYAGREMFFSPLKYVEIYSTYFKYNEKWIIGKTTEEIIARYGEFDSGRITSTNATGSSYYILVDDWAVKYVMYVRFENNIAVDIYRDTLW